MANHLITVFIVLTANVPISVIVQAVETAIVAFVEDALIFVLILLPIFVLTNNLFLF